MGNGTTSEYIKKAEATNFSPSERIHIYNVIIRVWQNHINILLPKIYQYWPFIYNAYQILFEILYQLKDQYRIATEGMKLVKLKVVY